MILCVFLWHVCVCLFENDYLEDTEELHLDYSVCDSYIKGSSSPYKWEEENEAKKMNLDVFFYDSFRLFFFLNNRISVLIAFVFFLWWKCEKKIPRMSILFQVVVFFFCFFHFWFSVGAEIFPIHFHQSINQSIGKSWTSFFPFTLCTPWIFFIHTIYFTTFTCFTTYTFCWRCTMLLLLLLL